MVTKVEKRGTGIYVVSEANGSLSREQVTVSADAAAVLPVATVLGKLTADSKYVPVDLGASDGSEVAVAVLYAEVDATEDDQRAVVHTRVCEVDGNELVYPEGASEGDITTINGQLADLNVIVRY